MHKNSNKKLMFLIDFNSEQQRTILKVVVEKIGKASATVHGDLR